MKAEQISTWIGIATAFAGVVASFVTMETKLDALESKMAEIYNVEEIRALERRLTTLEVTQQNSDISHISATIATIQGNIKNVETRVDQIKETDTSEIQSGVRVNKSRISNLESKIERVIYQVEKSNQNPLG
jgi:chromosome segregation ATPase|tara:strand:+ start:132 stop:527 length:396 start_codon:yes stop_codon:yes gene_type:complete